MKTRYYLPPRVRKLLLEHLESIGWDRLEKVSNRDLRIVYQEIYLRSIGK